MQIKNLELRDLLLKLSEEQRRLAELFAQALGEDHVLDCIKRNKETFTMGEDDEQHGPGWQG